MLLLACSTVSAQSAAEMQSGTKMLENEFSNVQQQVEEVVGAGSVAEWLGPLAPIAISPFFGQACLFGLASYGPDWVQQRSSLLGEESPFNNATLFWVFAGLAVLTSLPRFTKVSKPLALAAEKIEMSAAVVTFVILRFFSSGEATSVDEVMPELAVVHAGFLPQMSTDILLSLAAALNIIVINVVKLFFEFLVWLIPFPMVDAILEVCNKSLSAALMGLYLMSPLLATVLNLALVVVCGFVFMNVVRRTRYYRSLVLGPLLAKLFPGWFGSSDSSIGGFLTTGGARHS